MDHQAPGRDGGAVRLEARGDHEPAHRALQAAEAEQQHQPRPVARRDAAAQPEPGQPAREDQADQPAPEAVRPFEPEDALEALQPEAVGSPARIAGWCGRGRRGGSTPPRSSAAGCRGRGAHSMMDRPEPVSRVAPPRATIAQTMAATTSSQTATARDPAIGRGRGAEIGRRGRRRAWRPAYWVDGAGLHPQRRTCRTRRQEWVAPRAMKDQGARGQGALTRPPGRLARPAARPGDGRAGRAPGPLLPPAAGCPCLPPCPAARLPAPPLPASPGTAGPNRASRPAALRPFAPPSAWWSRCGTRHRTSAPWSRRSRPRWPARRTRSFASTTAPPTTPRPAWSRPAAFAARRRPGRLRHARSCGQSAAVVTGVRAARAPWIATLDGDGQNDPADIPRLWARARAEGADTPPPPGAAAALLVAGWRTTRQDTAMKRLHPARRQRACARGCSATRPPTPAAA